MEIIKLVFLIGCGGTFVLLAACCGGNSWRDGSLYSAGLWSSCEHIFHNCYRFDASSDKFRAIRAFSVISVLVSALAALMAFIGLCSDKIKGGLPSVFLIIAGISAVIALSIYTDLFGTDASYGWSFYIGWAGAVAAIVCALIGFKV